MRSLLLAAAFATALAPAAYAAGLCPAWSEPEKAGDLDMAQLSNASGLAASTRFPGRLYHHNDAQGGPVFFVTDEAGANLQKVTVIGYSPQDLESVDVGPCAGSATCVFLADLGDNAVSRPEMAIAALLEKSAFAADETPLRVMRAKYPDGPHNAEAMAMHPIAGLFILTKINRGEPATLLYRLTPQQLAEYDGRAAPLAMAQPLEEVARIDLAKLLTPVGGAAPTRMLQATGMDISPDGKTFVILTYSGAVELNFDLSQPLPPQDQWVEGRDYRRIVTASLPQAEGVAYAADGKSILYTSEYMRGGPESPIMRQRCLAQ